MPLGHHPFPVRLQGYGPVQVGPQNAYACRGQLAQRSRVWVRCLARGAGYYRGLRADGLQEGTAQRPAGTVVGHLQNVRRQGRTQLEQAALRRIPNVARQQHPHLTVREHQHDGAVIVGVGRVRRRARGPEHLGRHARAEVQTPARGGANNRYADVLSHGHDVRIRA